MAVNLSKKYDPRNWRKWRRTGAMSREEGGGIHCFAKEGETSSACGLETGSIMAQANFVAMSEASCCPACWEFAKRSSFFRVVIPLERLECYEPMHIPRTIHAERFRRERHFTPQL